MNDMIELSKDDIVYLLYMYMYSDNRFSYMLNILIDKNSGRKFFSLDDVFSLSGTVIRNKKKYLEGNATTIKIVKEDEEPIFGRYISEYYFLAVLMKSTVTKYRKFSEWLLNEIYPNINRRLLEEEPLGTKYSLTDDNVVNKIVTEVNEVLEKYKNKRRKDDDD